MTVESGLNVVKQKEKEQPDDIPLGKENKIRDCRFCGRNHERRNCPAFGQTCAYCKKKNHFVAKCPAKSKVSTVQEQFYLSTAGVAGGQGREVVTLSVSKDADSMTGHEVAFLMDTGAECNLLPLDVYKGLTGDLDLKCLDTRVKSVLILANGL